MKLLLESLIWNILATHPHPPSSDSTHSTEYKWSRNTAVCILLHSHIAKHVNHACSTNIYTNCDFLFQCGRVRDHGKYSNVTFGIVHDTEPDMKSRTSYVCVSNAVMKCQRQASSSRPRSTDKLVRSSRTFNSALTKPHNTHAGGHLTVHTQYSTLYLDYIYNKFGIHTPTLTLDSKTL